MSPLLYATLRYLLFLISDHTCFSWVKADDEPLRLIDGPLEVLMAFPSLLLINDETRKVLTPRLSQLPSSDQLKPQDWIHLIPKLRELTISAEAFGEAHLKAFGKNYWTKINGRFEDDDEWGDKYHEGEELRQRIERRKVRRARKAAVEAKANFSALEELTHLHLYFAKMDMMDNELLGFVEALPKLTHLRLTRPSSFFMDTTDLEGDTAHHGDLGDAIEALLGDEAKLQMIILQLSSNLGECVLEKLFGLHLHYPDRLQILIPRGIRPYKISKARWSEEIEKPIKQLKDSYKGIQPDWEDILLQQNYGRKKNELLVVDNEEAAKVGLDSVQVTDACEERGFQHFAQRAGGEIGVWSKWAKCLW